MSKITPKVIHAAGGYKVRIYVDAGESDYIEIIDDRGHSAYASLVKRWPEFAHAVHVANCEIASIQQQQEKGTSK